MYQSHKRVLKREKSSIAFSITGAKANEKIQRGGYCYIKNAVEVKIKGNRNRKIKTQLAKNGAKRRRAANE